MVDSRLEKEPFHVTVANKLIERLKEGTAPWQIPWEPGEASGHLPHNPITGKRYNGINVLQLMSEGRQDTRWMTYKQAASEGWQVRKGEKGTPVQYWKFSDEVEKTDDSGNVLRNHKGEIEKETVMLDRPRVFWATVFNAEQMDGVPERVRKEPSWDRIERAESIIEASGMQVSHDQSDRAFYRVSTDRVHMPGREQFPTADNYYATKLHEMGHWTGHPSRLDRPVGQNPFGSQEYAKEELRAEIASMIIGDELGIGHDPGLHASYVKSWIKALQDDPMEIFRAAADAEKIQKFVMAFEQQQQQGQNQSQAVEPASRYVEMLNQGGRLVDRLMDSNLMSAVDAQMTDARRDLLSVTVSREADAAAFAEASRQAFGVKLSEGWNGQVELGAMRDGKPWVATQGAETYPNEFYVRTGITGATGLDGFQEIGVFKSEVEAVACADRLLMIDAYSQHAASRPQDVVGELEKLDQRRVDARMQLFGSSALEGYSPSESWENLQRSAEQVGLKASIELGKGSDKPEFLIRYVDQAGAFTPITTELNTDGKAVTLVDGKRLGRKAPTEDHTWQREALEEAAHHVTTKQHQQEAKMVPTEPAAEKTYISVPFKEKNEAKELGARWDGKATSWYVPQGSDLALFSKWRTPPEPDKGSELEPGQEPSLPSQSQQPATEKRFLAVPYGEREQASALGARWDKAAKTWFIGQGDDPEKFKRWDPAHIAQLPKMGPEEEFKQACEAAGLKFDGSPIMDGSRYRVALVDDKRGEKNGVYIGHLDGHPAGYIKNFRTGVAMNWKSQGFSATDEEKAQLNAEAAEKLQAREAERAKEHDRIAARVQRELSSLLPPATLTPYQQSKGISIHKGVLTDREGSRTYIPAQDADGKTWTMQYIGEDGTKRFPKAGKKEGCFHVVGGVEALAKAPVLAVGEGYATMTTAAECLDMATVVAFDSGNLKLVAAALQEKYPGKPVLIIGDDDVLSAEKSPYGINAGRTKAESAAKDLKAMAVFPVFAPGESKQGLSDFNDLATKSALGRDSAERQLKSALSQCLTQARDQTRQQNQNRRHERESAGMSR